MSEDIELYWNGSNVTMVRERRILELGDECIETEDEGNGGLTIIKRSNAVDVLHDLRSEAEASGGKGGA